MKKKKKTSKAVLLFKKWTYDYKDVDKPPVDAIGFVYEIRFTDGSFYIGKKNFYTKRKRRFGKKEVARLKDKRRRTWEYVIKESNWKLYTSSSKEVNDRILKGDYHHRKILAYAYDKKSLSYLEEKYMFKKNVLESDKAYNGNIRGRYFKGILDGLSKD